MIEKQDRRLCVHEGRFWDVFLHPKQNTLGAVYFWYKPTPVSISREEVEFYSLLSNSGQRQLILGSKSANVDFLDLPPLPMQEYQKIGVSIKEVLYNLFQVIVFHHACLCDQTCHTHIHLIPRYLTPRKFDDLSFADEGFGGHWRERTEAIPEEILVKIAQVIRKKLASKLSPP